jgi:hypothetical protein
MGIERGGHNFKGLRIPISTPNHKTKSHAVLIGTTKKPELIRYGEQGAKTNQSAAQRKAFKDRHRKNIAKGETSAAYWANRTKWQA